MPGGPDGRTGGQASARRHRSIGTLLVVAQFGLIGATVLPVGPTVGPQLPALGLLCWGTAAVVGGLALLALGADTRVHPVPHGGATLRTGGIYARVRHPMYTAVLLACLGVSLSTARVLSWAALAVLVAVLIAKSRFEDHLLERRFGSAFAAYRDRVPALVPRLRWSARL